MACVPAFLAIVLSKVLLPSIMGLQAGEKQRGVVR